MTVPGGWSYKCSRLVILSLHSGASDLMGWGEACAWGLSMDFFSGEPERDLVKSLALFGPSPSLDASSQGCEKLGWFSLLSPGGFSC